MTNKYRAKKVKTSDGTFDSQAEYRRWCELKLLEEAGEIEGLQRQVGYALGPPRIEAVGTYKADFVYYAPAGETGRLVVEDCKGAPLTELYKLKRALMLACSGVAIFETGPSASKRKPKRKSRRRGIEITEVAA